MEYLANVRQVHLDAMLVFVYPDIHVTELSSGFQLLDGYKVSDDLKVKSHLTLTIEVQR